MSQLQQAKREAKRLLKIAQDVSENTITIKNLSEAREKIATINGYNSWHDFEENLKRKDLLQGIPISSNKKSENVEDPDYYLQAMEFKLHLKKSVVNQRVFISDKIHKPIELGTTKKSTFKAGESQYLDKSPVTIIGSTGAGRTETLLSMGSQWINNNEGLIYLDGKGDSVIYSKVFSYCQSANRIKDLYVLNFMANENGPKEKKYTHSIDPLNHLIENLDILKSLLGDEPGVLLNEIGIEMQKNNMLMDSSHIKSILMLPNLEEWASSGFFGLKATENIKKYLKKINLTKPLNELEPEELKEIYSLHQNYSIEALNTANVIEIYEKKGVFSKEPELDLYDIIINRKVLVVLFPAFEKMWAYYQAMAHITVANLSVMTKKIHLELKEKTVNLQNIVVDEAHYCVSPKISSILFSSVRNSSNWVFGFQDYEDRNQLINQALAVSKTVIMMKTDYVYAPVNLAGRIFSNIKNPENIFYERSLMHLQAGQAYVYVENDKPTFNYLNMCYIPAKNPQEIWLNRVEAEKKIIQEFTIKELLVET